MNFTTLGAFPTAISSSGAIYGGGGGGGGRLGGTLLDLLAEADEKETSRRRTTSLGCACGDLTAAAVIAALGRDDDCVVLMGGLLPEGDPGAEGNTCLGTGGAAGAETAALTPKLETDRGGCIPKTGAPLGGPAGGAVVGGGLPSP